MTGKGRRPTKTIKVNGGKKTGKGPVKGPRKGPVKGPRKVSARVGQEKAGGEKVKRTIFHRPVVLTLLSFLLLSGLVFVQNIAAITHLGYYFVLMMVAIVLLVTASERFLVDAKGLARSAGLAEIIIGLTVVSIGTSLPEIAATGMASYQAQATGDPGLSDFALGNIFGSVLVQITFILGMVVLVKPMIIDRGSVKRDGMAMILAVSLLSYFTVMDGRLGRLESLALVIIYALFLYYLVANRHRIMAEEQAGSDFEKEQERKEEQELSLPAWGHLLMMAFAMALIIYSSERLVFSASRVAERLGTPAGVIGLTISGVGTSLPELAIALVCLKEAKGVAMGTLVGSNVTDPLLSIGIAGIINPIVISTETAWLFTYLIVPFTLVACVLGVAFMWSDWKIERWEGGVLVGAYVLFVLLVLAYM